VGGAGKPWASQLVTLVNVCHLSGALCSISKAAITYFFVSLGKCGSGRSQATANSPDQRRSHSQGPTQQHCGIHVSKVRRQEKLWLANAEELAALQLTILSPVGVLL